MKNHNFTGKLRPLEVSADSPVGVFLHTMIDPEADILGAMIQVAHVLRSHRGKNGAWRKRSIAHHLRHAVRHLALWFVGVGREPHLAHAATRCLMALELATGAAAPVLKKTGNWTELL